MVKATNDQEKAGAEGGRRARRTRSLLLVGGGLALLVALGLAFRPQPVRVDLIEVRVGTVEVVVEEDGRTRVRDRYLVSAPVAGSLIRPTLRPGDSVEAGDVILEIEGGGATPADPRTQAQLQVRLAGARAQVEQAQAQLQAAQAGLADAREALRQQEVLRAGGGAPQLAVDRARALLEVREAEVRSAGFGVEVARGQVEDLRLALTTPEGERGRLLLRAPATGLVLRVHRESGGSILPGEPLLEVGDPRHLEAVVDLLSADAVRLSEGAEATLEGWGGDASLPARVRRIEPAGFTRISSLGIEEQRVNVLLDPVGEGAWSGLGDGFRIEARILVDRAEGVLLVPSGALFRRGEGWAVFVATNGRIRERPVEIGRRGPGEVEVVSGLVSGERVVVYPSDRVADGVRVRAR